MSSSASAEQELRVDLYQTDDYKPFGRVGLSPLLLSVFEKALEQPLDDATFTLYFLAVADGQELDGEPVVVNLRGSHGFVNVQITREGRVLYQHPHSVREIFGRPLQLILGREWPDVRHWGYGIAGPGLEHVPLVRPAPYAEGSVNLGRSRRPRLFHIEEVAEADPPLSSLADLGVTTPVPDEPEHPGERVVFLPEVRGDLLERMSFSHEVEEGGFLVGRIFRDSDREGHSLVVVTEALPAERTGASLLRFTFTGESFLRVNDVISRRGPEQRLVGWYHTHLFAPTDNLGLSTIDVDLHARTFRRPWQVAGLINIDDDTRTLRVYGWDGIRMHELQHWVGEPSATAVTGDGEWTQ